MDPIFIRNYNPVGIIAVRHNQRMVTGCAPKFELGGNFTALRLSGTGLLGPGIEGDVNFGRYLALDAAYSWLPSSPQHVMTALFGAKAGIRTKHVGLFAKVRPGFV